MIALPLLLIWAFTGMGYEFGFVEKAWYGALPGEPPGAHPRVGRVRAAGHRRRRRRRRRAADARDRRDADRGRPARCRRARPRPTASGSPTASTPGRAGRLLGRHAGLGRPARRRRDDDHVRRSGALAQALWEDWNFPTHAGWVVNPWVRHLAVLGLAPLLLAITGLSTWLYKRGLRKRAGAPRDRDATVARRERQLLTAVVAYSGSSALLAVLRRSGFAAPGRTDRRGRRRGAAARPGGDRGVGSPAATARPSRRQTRATCRLGRPVAAPGRSSRAATGGGQAGRHRGHVVVALACGVVGSSSGCTRRGGDIVRILVVAYTVLAVVAGARAAVQLATRADEAPLPYGLSAVAAAVYLILAVALRRPGRWRSVALVAATVELAGVLAVGLAEELSVTAWPDETVWSGFGAGYGWAPLVLPIAALVLLAPSRRGRHRRGAGRRRQMSSLGCRSSRPTSSTSRAASVEAEQHARRARAPPRAAPYRASGSSASAARRNRSAARLAQQAAAQQQAERPSARRRCRAA